jgi:hypothetical protein
MLELLRIRRKAFKGSDLRKYSLFAFGEIMLVMVGILLALQVNNWNENRKDQIRVRSHLNEIKSELEFDLEKIQQIIVDQESAYEATLLLQNSLNQNIYKIDTQQLKLALFEAGYLTIFNKSRGAFNNLISSGDIQLIKDNKLKRALISFHNEENWSKSYLDGPMIKAYEKYLEYIHQISKPGMIPNYYIHEFMKEEELSTTIKKSFKNPDSFALDLNKIHNDQKISFIIDQVLANRVIQNQIYHMWKNQMEELILQIEKNISK